METIDLSRFDSTAGISNLKTQIEKSENNALTLTNISHKVNFNNEFYTYDYTALERYKGYLSQFVIKAKCPESLYYHPELVAKLIYGSIDLWYLVLMFNPIPSAAEFNLPVINIFDPNKIGHINRILSSANKDLRFNKAKPEFIEKHTLTPVRVKDTRLI